MTKYHSRKCEIDGIVFASKKECEYYVLLKSKVRAKVIKGFDMQVPFILQPSYKKDGKTIRAIKYIADFVVTDLDGNVEVIDVKGYRTKEYLIKKKMLLYRYPEINFKEV